MLKIGVLGAGHIGKFHLNNWKDIPSVEIVGFYEPNDAIAKEVAETYQIQRYLTVEELLQYVDAVDIDAPTNYHFELCEKAVRSGKHVFVEKPIVKSLEEGRKLINMVHEANVKVQVGHVERFNPAFVAARKYIKEPLFIEVHRLAQFNPRGTEVSVILDLMIHDIDIILSIVKSDVKNIYASGVGVITETPDIANVRIEFHNGCVANMTSSRISMKKMRKLRVFQKDAYIGIDFLEKKTEIIKLSHPDDENAFSFNIDTPDGTKKEISIANPKITDANAMREELESFVDAIAQDKPTAVNEIDGYLALEVAHKILEKIHHNKVMAAH